jgi:hypothetical protein
MVKDLIPVARMRVENGRVRSGDCHRSLLLAPASRLTASSGHASTLLRAQSRLTDTANAK